MSNKKTSQKPSKEEEIATLARKVGGTATILNQKYSELQRVNSEYSQIKKEHDLLESKLNELLKKK